MRHDVPCQPDDLGKPLPDTKHAVSVALPTWQDVIDYEEGKACVLDALQSGYPRFVYHPTVAEFFRLCEKKFAKKGEFCVAFPSQLSAIQCQHFVKPTSSKIEVHPYGVDDVHIVCFPESDHLKVKQFWQHAGLGISSRYAEMLIEDKDVPSAYQEAKQSIKETISDLLGEIATDNIYLFNTGMAAIFQTYEAFLSVSAATAAEESTIGHDESTKRHKTIQLGFPYVDTLKVQEKFGEGVHFIPYNDVTDLQSVEKILEVEKIAALFCEFPGNPLLYSIDLDPLSKLLGEYGVPLVIDDTLATWHNVDLLSYADVLVTSLTKFFSGVGDVTGGSLVINPKSPYFETFKQFLDLDYEDLLFAGDAVVLDENSHDFTKRMIRINDTTEILCEYLYDQPTIKQVYYPKYINTEVYERYKKPEGGYGGLFSIEFEDSSAAPLFYDNLEVCKGPNLGTNFTLACPYTLIAHYHELDFAKACGVSSDLIRVSVGLEDADDLVSRFKEALRACD